MENVTWKMANVVLYGFTAPLICLLWFKEVGHASTPLSMTILSLYVFYETLCCFYPNVKNAEIRARDAAGLALFWRRLFYRQKKPKR